MGGRSNGHWSFCVINLPKGGGKGLQVGRKINLAGQDPDAGVEYRGYYQVRKEDKPGDALHLHFRLDPSASRGSVVDGVRFVTTEEREAFIEMQQQKQALTTTSHTNGTKSGASAAASPSAAVPAPQQQPPKKCERLLERIVAGPDGQGLQLVKLCGEDVPRDVELYFCLRTFIAVQARIKVRVNGLVHEYVHEPETVNISGGGVLDLQCQKSAHHVELKVQPTLGLKDLLSSETPPSGPSDSQDNVSLERLPALLALYHILAAFSQDPTRSSFVLAGALAKKMAADSVLLQAFNDRCPIFNQVAGAQPPVLHLRPKSRGKLLKALFEVKMLLVGIARQLRKAEGSLRDDQQEQLNELQSLEGQHQDEEASRQALKLAVCGDVQSAAMAGSLATIRECAANCRNSILPKLQGFKAPGELREPSAELTSASAAVDFKHKYNRLWRAAIETYLYDYIHDPLQYPKGPQAGMKFMQMQWARPDAALQQLFPSSELNDAIEFWQGELDVVLTNIAISRGHDAPAPSQPAARDVEPLPPAPATSTNPDGSTGLDNPGENLCATNSLIQFLFSANALRAAAVETKDLPPKEDAGGHANDSASKSLYTTLEQEAGRLVPHLRKLFSQMADPSCVSASVRDVAGVLYSGEVGEQQDPDELMHRMSSLLQDGLEAIPGDPFAALRQTFQRLFVGATYEVHVRRVEELDKNARESEFETVVRSSNGLHAIGYPKDQNANKQFLCIPVQQVNQTLKQALEDFTGWTPVDGSDVAWMQEQFRRLPPFLCFATRQVSNLEWEESLNLTPFVVPTTPLMQRDRYERSLASQLRHEFCTSLEQLASTRESLSRANQWCGHQLKGDISRLSDLSKELQSRADALDQEITSLDERIGDGFDDPPVKEFLKGVVQDEVIENVVHGLLGANTVKKLADLVFDGDENGNDTLEQLVTSGMLARADEASIAKRLQQRHEQHREHIYDAHALVVYHGTGHVGHYIVFVRQPNGAFFCFDDEQVTEYPNAGAVRADIAERGSEALPASMRMIVYRKRKGDIDQPLELSGPTAAPMAGEPAAGNEPDAKRPRTS